VTQPTDPPAPTIRESLKILFGASRGYWLVNLANFGDGIAYFGMLALMTLFMELNVGFSAQWSTISIGWYTGAVTIFMALGGGVVADRLGVRRALTLCIGVLIVGRVLFVLSPTLGGSFAIGMMAWIGLFVMAAGEGVIQPALYAGIKEYTDKRTATLGYAFLYAIMNLGIVAGEIASPLVREWWAHRVEGLDVAEHPAAGISGAFWFFTGITVLMLLINVGFFTRKVEERDRVADAKSLPGDSDEKFDWMDYLRNLPILDKRFLFFILILLPVRTLFAHQWLTIPTFVTRAFPPEIASRWEWINGLNPLIIVIFVPLIAALTQKRRIVDMMIIGTTISALATFILVGEADWRLLIAYFIIWSLGEAFWASRFLEYIADIAPMNRVGVYMGIATIPWFLAKTITGMYAGTMLDIYVPIEGVHTPGTMWVIYGVTALISPIGLILARRWLLSGIHSTGVGEAGTTPSAPAS